MISDLFPDVFYFLLLHEELGMEDTMRFLEQVDQLGASSLQNTLHQFSQLEDEEIRSMDWTFRTVVKSDDTPYEMDLQENADEVVCKENLERFILLKAQYPLYGYRARRIYEKLREGFSAVILKFKQQKFNYKELRSYWRTTCSAASSRA